MKARARPESPSGAGLLFLLYWWFVLVELFDEVFEGLEVGVSLGFFVVFAYSVDYLADVCG